ncbi:antitoxin MazE-like protein [Sinorhizobium meliloti]|uniref:antitoxin MazE-like protein n=1 Tax=Rhizobium meliloti TaxID=382 RepID=UPI00192DBB61|nr:antitoxin MazE-like protein [Sinorhizobium meliloti]
MRAAGVRPVQIRIPGNRRPGFADECRRQAEAVAAADAAARDLDAFIDAALSHDA